MTDQRGQHSNIGVARSEATVLVSLEHKPEIHSVPSGEDFTELLLELGGQNPAIVDESANLPDAAKKIVWGKTAWGGQWCTSPGYACVHESVADRFVTEAKAALIALLW